MLFSIIKHKPILRRFCNVAFSIFFIIIKLYFQTVCRLKKGKKIKYIPGLKVVEYIEEFTGLGEQTPVLKHKR